MATIKSVCRSATVAFSPTVPDVLAMGTMAGAIDPSFSAAASLDIFRADFSRPDTELELLSSYSSSEKFNSISWGTAGTGGDEYPYGLLASGLDDGTVCIWNPGPLIRQEGNTESVIAKLQKHNGLVRGLEFNVLSPNLLASGGDDGYLNIWDFANPAAPSHYPPLKGGGQDHIVDLSWNRKVQHIMATTSNTGVSVVWDLRRQKSVLSFADSSNRRPSAAIEWNPENSTQLIVASADDKFPTLQVWDLRNAISPEKELVGHTKGLVAMAWCPIDSTLLLSSAKDYRTLCWDTVSGEVVCELPMSSNWNFDVQWSPRIPGLLSTSSYDGKVNLYNIEACSRILPSEGHFGAGTPSASMKAPKWLKRPVGVTFGFGGKLVSFTSKKVNVQTLVTEEELVGQSKEFETAISNHEDKSALRALCQKKADESESTEEKEIWSFLRIMFEENARTSLISHLGFKAPSVDSSEVEKSSDALEDLNTDMAENLNIVNGNAAANDDGLGRLDSEMDNMDDGADFFNNLSTPKGPVSPQIAKSIEPELIEGKLETLEESELDDYDECDRNVENALIIADFKAAVKHCLSQDRMDEALVVAKLGGEELYKETLEHFFRKFRRPYKKVLGSLVDHDARRLVHVKPLNAWKTTLALLCTYAGSEDWTELCDALAARLDAAGNKQAALLCYICAANTEELARIWYKELQSHSNSTVFIKQLQDLMEKIVILALARGEKQLSSTLARLVESYVMLLLSQGNISGAEEYLGLLRPEESPEAFKLLKTYISPGVSYPAYVPTQEVPYTQGAQYSQGSSYPAYVPTQEVPYTQGSSYPGYVPKQDPAPYAQPGIFYPTPPSQLSTTPNMPTQIFYPNSPTQFTNPAVPPQMPNVSNGVVSDRTSNVLGSARSFMPPTQMAPPPPREFSPYPVVNRAPMPQQPAPPVTNLQPPQSISSPVVSTPVTIQTVDTSDVPADLKPVVNTLTRLFNETTEALGGIKANPAKKREIEDNNKKLGVLFAKLNKGDISQNARTKLIDICRSIDARDYATAVQLQVSLTTSDWDECGSWLSPLKRMIKIRQTLQ